ncbi:MAG: SLC13 family permease [Simkaniaceae bacterium]
MPLSLYIFGTVFFVIIFRQFSPIKIEIWKIMTAGALAVLLFRQMTFLEAMSSVNWEVIFFLLGMFFLGQAVEESHLLTYSLEKWFERLSDRTFLAAFIFGIGLFSAIFMNDTIAIIGTPAAIYCLKKKNYPAAPIFIALCFSLTIGSVCSPIGNPQNLLITLSGNIADPFKTFFFYLLIPSIINLFILFLMLHFWIKKTKIKKKWVAAAALMQPDRKLAKLCKWSLGLLCMLILFQIAGSVFYWKIRIDFVYLSLIPALIIFLGSSKRVKIAARMDWGTLVFFISLFILMHSVQTKLPLEKIAKSYQPVLSSHFGILLASLVLSQLISNVPAAAVLLPLLPSSQDSFLMALAAGTTVAGNILVLGAASNVIVVEKAEKKGIMPFSAMQFLLFGLIVTAIHIAVYWAYLFLVT